MRKAALSSGLMALFLSSGTLAWGEEPAQPEAQGRTGVTRPTEEQKRTAGPQGVSPAGGAGGGRSSAPT